jgi:hypothetical protein
VDRLRVVLTLLLVALGVLLAVDSFAACPVGPGDWDYCSICGPCGLNQGDCDSDADCVEGLICEQDVGPEHGLANGIDVCRGTVTPPAPTPDPSPTPSPTPTPVPTPPPAGGTAGCAFPVGHPDYCFSCGPCTEGQGGCNRNYQCVTGLVCNLETNRCVRP